MIEKDELPGENPPAKVKTKIGNDTGNDLLSCFLLFCSQKNQIHLIFNRESIQFLKSFMMHLVK